MSYEECNDCMAKSWCKIYSGEVQGSKNPWCSAKYRLDKALELSRIPKLYLNANIYNYELDKNNKRIFNIITKVVDDITSYINEGINFFFFGANPGTGKTFNASVLVNHYIYKTCLTYQFDFENPLGFYIVYADLMDDLRYRRDLDSVQDTLRLVNKVPLLLLDDIGSGTNSSFTRDQTYLIINNRINNGLSTIYTSNLAISELKDSENLGVRNTSRILNNAIGQKFEGKDRRILTARRVE
jgi:DNA replication protein DnaC